MNNMNSSPSMASAASARQAQPSDPLLTCLALVARLLDRPVHLPVLRAGFALDAAGRVPLSAYPDMAHKHGLMAAWSRTRLSALPSYVLPVLVSLQDGRACVLKAIAGQHAVVLWAESGLDEHHIDLQELQSLAHDEVLVVKAASVQ